MKSSSTSIGLDPSSSSSCSSRHPSILSDNGKPHGFGKSILFGATSGVADKSNPRVAVSVTGGAAEGGGLVGVQGLLTLFPVLSLVLQQPVSLVLTPFRTALRHALRSSAICSQLPGSMSASLRSRLQTSLKHSAGQPA